jgi:glycosyltransferase involved in cell wall biosynthesis
VLPAGPIAADRSSIDIAAPAVPADRAAARVAIAPAASRHNRFINHFAASIAAGGFQVMEFAWNPLQLAQASIAILHWPNEFFASSSHLATSKAALKLQMLRTLRRLRGLKLVWVAHNARPHDTQPQCPALTRRFLDLVDGVIYLSKHSRGAIHALYQLPPATLELVTAHGHYRDQHMTPAAPLQRPTRQVRMVHFGQVRPYKNIDELVRCASRVAHRDIHLTVAGLRQDERLAARIAQLASTAHNIRLDLRGEPLAEAELEATIDAGHAVVLPYREILNSGAALYALSRNRPVLAPRLGSLPELQHNVGSDWVYLYDGPLTSTVLEEFANWMRGRVRRGRPDLSAYDWDRIGEDTCRFIDRLRVKRGAYGGPRGGAPRGGRRARPAQ